MRLMIKAALVALCLAAPVPAVAGPLEDGNVAWARNDFATALRHWRPLAEQGNGDAQVNIGTLYQYGDGVPQDYGEALRWYRRAAEKGHGMGQNYLGLMYYRGSGVPQDYVLAHMWFNLAAAQGALWGAIHRDEVAAKMTPAQIAEAQRLAREWQSSR